MKNLPYLIKDTFNFFRTNILGIWNILFPVIVPLSMAGAIRPELFPSEESVSWGLLGVAVMLYPIVQAALIFYISSVVSGDEFPRNICYRLSVRFWGRLIVLYLISVLAICAGFILLVIPGLIVMARIMFSEFYCLLYKQGSMEAFNSSWKQSKPYQWILLAGIILITIFTSVPIWLLEKGAESVGVTSILFTFFIGLIESMLGCLITIFGYRVFTLHIENFNSQNQHD